MAHLTVDNVQKTLPVDEFQAQKVTSYNSALVAIDAAWTVWTPTWTNLSVGNGTVTAKYRQIGRLVIAHLHVVFGSTTSISGAVDFTLPVNRATYAGTAGLTSLGPARFFDTSVPAGNEGQIVNIAADKGRVYALNASGTYLASADLSSTIPFTWATGDEINAQLVYEAA